MAIDSLIEKIEKIQKTLNNAIIKKETEISKKASIDQDVNELQEKCKKEFNCEVKELVLKKEQIENEIKQKINEINEILGID